MTLLPAIANRLYMASALPARRRLERALRNPTEAQEEVLLRIVRGNEPSVFGRRHGFRAIRSVADFRARVPVRSYDEIEQELLRAAEDRRGVVTSEPVVCFEPTGGSSGSNKLIPYTRSLLAEFSAATLPWVYDLLQHRPALRDGRAYWAVSPPARRAAFTAGGIPIGLEHDSDYFPAFAGAMLDKVIGMPRALSRLADIDTWRYVTLRALIAVPDLAFISVWNPSFLSLLTDALDANWERLVDDLDNGEWSVRLDARLRHELTYALPARPALAALLRRRFHRRLPEDLGELWPQLRLISCWTDAHAARALPGVTKRFPKVEVQGKGLLATEGVVSIPLFDAGGCVAAVTSHFLEFIPGNASSDPVGVEALEAGETYEVVLTTSGGLYRYRLKDLVRVEGFHHRTPLLSFQGRVDHTSDLVGEKLSPIFAERVLREAALETGVRTDFAMLTPVCGGIPRYDLLVDCAAPDADRLAGAVESGLTASHHYALCRRLGQLDGVRAVVMPDGARTYERMCLARGQRAGSIKPTALDANWIEEVAP